MKTKRIVKGRIIIALLFLISFFACHKAKDTDFKKLYINISKKEVVALVGKGNKGIYNLKESTWQLSFDKDSLINIIYISKDKNKQDSTMITGYFHRILFNRAGSDGIAKFNSAVFGPFRIIINDSTQFINPIKGNDDLMSGYVSSHIFRITGKVFQDGDSYVLVANKIEDLSAMSKGEKE